ncbi:tyrosine-protein phosphatase 1-like [Uloborus diversus]|uniref:tyrosine-protein phosphatase 1-like n=1 Tax=Uloborus diversus TaxID=327109 RepID=UPI00240955FB|nr:tyrosine-protein phosphatase 1-like [Uloborus diversus]
MIFGRKPPANEADEQSKGEKCLSTMRQSFHRALTTCKAPLPPGKKYVAVQFLTKEIIFYVVDAKGKGQEVFDEASKHLGLLDAELFGLAFYQDGDYIFVDLNLRVSKYAVKSWKTHSNGIGGDGQPLLILHMRIKYYVDCHLLINEKVVRHHYYLQLRENVKNYSQSISEEKSFLLAALALQADLGNYDKEKHKNRYFEIGNYFPAWIITKIGEDFIVRNVPALHKDNAGLSRGEAQVGYIKEASDITAPHNMHFYRMRRKRGKIWNFLWLGIRDSGIHIYEVKEPEKTKSLLSTFLWCDIAKLHFEKKKFEILSEGSPECRRFTYFLQSEDLAKHLLWICKTTHHFHMANQNRVADLKQLEIDGGKPYREAYIYTDKWDQAWEKKQNTLSKSRSKLKVENSAVNFNGNEENSLVEKSLKPVNMKMCGMPWNNVDLDKCKVDSQCIPQHHSMEVLPLLNGCKFSSDIKYKSQSISCFSDRSLTPYSPAINCNSTGHLWNPESGNSVSTTPTSTLMSRSSCTSNTDSTCSSLSLTSGSTLKVGSSLISQSSNDGSHWVKCDSFEELPVKTAQAEKVMHKVCISTFVDKHVRTASVYDAVTVPLVTPAKSSHTSTINPSTSSNPTVTKQLLGMSSSKVDVRRTPSLNVGCVSSNQKPIYSQTAFDSHIPLSAQKPNRHYAQNQVSSHGRTTTRIGVSSLSRDQRLPLTLFNNRRILACGSEPNLYAPIGDCDPETLVNDSIMSLKSQRLGRNLNSQSEISLNMTDYAVQSQNSTFSFKDSLNSSKDSDHCRSKSRQLSLPDVYNELDGETDFPCIPPPPAYRNEVGCAVSPSDSSAEFIPKQHFSENSQKVPVKIPLSRPSKEGSVLPQQASSVDVLDIQQLRQRSRDLDLPLISALCNDRSLLMLPKTVPTCSRQRHLGSKDPLRFNRTTSLPNGDGTDILLPHNGRPISWHVDSGQLPNVTEHVKPNSSSWDNNIKSRPLWLEVGRVESTIQSLPPTILTSFSKTPVKSQKSVRDPQSSMDYYRYNANQMIPTKLLACSLNGIASNRLYQKGSSS